MISINKNYQSEYLFYLIRNISFLLLIIVPFVAISQKLPNVQKASLRIPGNIRIDGKASEWNNQFQAHNHATSLFYSMANDDDNLYLIVHTDYPDALTKITTAGLKVFIGLIGENDDDNAISIMYPFWEVNNKPFISFKAKPFIDKNSPLSLAKADSFMLASNKHLNSKSRYIKTKGMPGIDTLISVYNTDGIKVGEAFDNTMAYTCEIEIPLKYLQPALNGSNKFTYHIMLPAVTGNDYGFKLETVNGRLTLSTSSGAGAAIPSKDHLAATYSITDFRGEYTLAK